MAQYHLRFFFDPGSGTCLWAGNAAARERFGYWVDPKGLPVPENIWRRVYHLAAWYDTGIDWEYPPGPTPWGGEECARFNDAARLLLADLRQRLGPDYEVLDEFRPMTLGTDDE